MFIITPRHVERKESGSMFCDTNHFLKFERIENIALKSTTIKRLKFTHPAVEPSPCYPWVCLHHTFVVRNLILRYLTGSHMTISSKSNYRVRLNVNMNIADSIPFYFNFGKGHYFVLRVKQHIFGKAQIFQMNRVNPAIINWREKK